MWLTILSGLMKLTLWVLNYLERQKIIDQERVRASYEQLKKANEIIFDVDKTIDSVSNTPNDVLLDRANRDQRTDGTGAAKSGVSDGVRDNVLGSGRQPGDDKANPGS